MLPTTIMTLSALVPAAHAASQADEAERDRIVEEMQVLAARQKWKGVEQLYGQLLPLEKRGAVIAPEQHMIAVELIQCAQYDGTNWKKKRICNSTRGLELIEIFK